MPNLPVIHYSIVKLIIHLLGLKIVVKLITRFCWITSSYNIILHCVFLKLVLECCLLMGTVDCCQHEVGMSVSSCCRGMSFLMQTFRFLCSIREDSFIFMKNALIFSAISSWKLIVLNKQPSRMCSCLVHIGQLSQLKQYGLSVLLKDTTYWSCQGLIHQSLY